MATRITIVAYKPDGSFSCMGHVQETFCSQFELKHYDGFPSAALFVAELEMQNKNLSEDEPAWQITVLVCGVPITECELYLKSHYEAALKHGHDVVQARAAEEVARKERETELAQEEARVAAHDKEMEAFFAAGAKLGYSIQPKT